MTSAGSNHPTDLVTSCFENGGIEADTEITEPKINKLSKFPELFIGYCMTWHTGEVILGISCCVDSARLEH